MGKNINLWEISRLGLGAKEKKKSIFAEIIADWWGVVVAGLVLIALCLFAAWFLFCPHTCHYYRVVTNDGKVYEVAGFTTPSRHNLYYQGFVNGEKYVFTNIESYSRMEKTYEVRYF